MRPKELEAPPVRERLTVTVYGGASSSARTPLVTRDIDVRREGPAFYLEHEEKIVVGPFRHETWVTAMRVSTPAGLRWAFHDFGLSFQPVRLGIARWWRFWAVGDDVTIILPHKLMSVTDVAINA